MSGYLGRYQQGEFVPLVIQTRNGSNTPVMPNEPVFVRLWNTSGFVKQVTMPIVDRYQATAIFALPLRLDSGFPPDRYRANYFYKTIDGYYGMEIDIFEVLPGGDPEGAIISMFYWERPESTYLVEQTQAGSVLLKRNPSV